MLCSLTAQKDQNIFVLVILKNKRHYLLDISKQYTHVFLNRLFRQADSRADQHLFQTRFMIGLENNRDDDITMPLSLKAIGSAVSKLFANLLKKTKILMFTKLLTRAPQCILIKSFFLAIGWSYLHDLSHTFLKRLKLL